MDEKQLSKVLKKVNELPDIEKLRKVGKQNYAFLTFADEAAESKGRLILTNLRIKNKRVEVEAVGAAEDETTIERTADCLNEKEDGTTQTNGDTSQRQESDEGPDKKRRRIAVDGSADSGGATSGASVKDLADDTPTADTDARSSPAVDVLCTSDVVTPWWKMPYDNQLLKKQVYLRGVLRDVVREMQKAMRREGRDFPPWMRHGGTCCPLEAVHPSPVIEGYRNKCDFTVAQDCNGDALAGFQLGLFRNGVVTVGSVDDCRNVSAQAKTLSRAFTEFLRTKSKLPNYSKVSHKGFWRAFTVRQGLSKEVLCLVQIDASEVEDVMMKDELNRLAEHLREVSLADGYALVSVVGHDNRTKSTSASTDVFFPIYGLFFIHDLLFDLRFRISPSAFFQVNTPCAERLYSIVREWCDPSPNTVLLDVCCGTGTIGICMARSVQRVIGVEMNESAVEDARLNANLNSIGNCVFVAGRAEKVLQAAIDEHVPRGAPCIAVVDPPRAGLHNDVIRALRKCSQIRRLVYISCNPKSFVNNSVNLCKAPSKALIGEAFVPVRACGVDLFPHTDHVELVVMLDRVTPKTAIASPSPDQAAISPSPDQLAIAPDQTLPDQTGFAPGLTNVSSDHQTDISPGQTATLDDPALLGTD